MKAGRSAMTMYWIYDLPNWLFGLLCIGFFSSVGLLGLSLTRDWVRRRHVVDHSHNDIVSYFLAAITVFYGITLGLLAVGTWTNYSSIEAKVDREAQVLGTLYRDTASYPAPFNVTLRNDLNAYLREVIDVSWPLQRKGIVPTGADPKLTQLQVDLLQFQPVTTAQQIIHAEAFKQFNELIEARRSRLSSVTTHMPRSLWTLVILGALITICVTLFFDTASLSMHRWLTLLLGTLIGLMIFLIGTLDNPFRGRSGVSAAPLVELYNQVNHR